MVKELVIIVAQAIVLDDSWLQGMSAKGLQWMKIGNESYTTIIHDGK